MNWEILFSVGLWIFIFLMTVTLHEYCHGFLADRLGDPTARQAGRLSLNPLRHIDPFWTILLPALLFISTRGQFMIGMARPVPVNFLNLRSPKRDMIWVAAAGPLANFFLAWVLSWVFKFFPTPFLLYAIYFNLGLAVFNLIPIPPLDGSRILLGLLPPLLASLYARLEPLGFVVVLALYFSGALYGILIPGIRLCSHILGIPRIEF